MTRPTGPMTFARDRFNFHAPTNTYTAEDSSLQINRHPSAKTPMLYLTLTDPDGGDIQFRFDGCDQDRHGDIAGWRYHECYGNRKAIIIND